MLFKAEITTPVNASADIALGQPTYAVPVRLRVSPGLVMRVWVGFPSGCFGLAHLQIWYQGWSVWPWSQKQSFHWDGYTFVFDERYPLTTQPYELVLHAWSYDDTFEHTLSFMCLIEPSPTVESTEGLSEVLRDLGILREAEEE